MPAVVVRHGKTDFNTRTESTERLRGWLDVPLDEDGVEEAAETAQALSSLPITHIYSSDLQRAKVTADALSQTTRAPISVHQELRPWNLGILQGQRISDIKEVMDHLTANPSLSAPQGESLQDFLHRFIPFILPLIHSPELSAVTTHFRNVVAIMAFIKGQGQVDPRFFQSQHKGIDPGEAFLVEPGRITPIEDPDQGDEAEGE